MAANALEPHFDDRHPERGSRARLGRQAGFQELGLSLYELEPGASPWPYHYHLGNEELLFVLRGTPSVRTADGWRELADGDVISFPRGERGAHQVANRSEEPARVLVLSEMNAPEVAVYPDSGKVGAAGRAPGSLADESLFAFFRLADEVDYWDGEE